MAPFKRKRIPKGNYRIIKISKDALLEFIYESIIDNQEAFFDVTDGTKIVTSFDMDWDTGELICVAKNETHENENLQFDIDLKEVMSKIQDTTNSLFDENRYIELSENELKNL